jgi:outer membrane protein insertion porin family
VNRPAAVARVLPIAAVLVLALGAQAHAAPRAPVVEDETEEEVPVASAASAPVAAPRYVVDAVELRGNWKTADYVILSRVDVKPGEVLDEEKVEISRLRLLATGFFRDVTTRLERSATRNHVVVVFRITESVPVPLVEGIYLGFSQVTPIFAGLSLVDNNFMGKGITVGLGGVVSPRQQGFRLRIVEPSILRSSVGLRARLVFNNGLEPIALGSSATAGGTVAYRRAGGSAGIMLTEGWVGRFAMDYRFEVLWGEFRVVPGASRPPRILPGLSRLSTLTLSFERDTRDRLFVPTDGSVLRFSAEGSSALLLSDYEYAKFRASYEALVPLRRLWNALREHALSLRLEAGYIQSGLPFGAESGAPFFEEFYVGDSSYFRYQRQSLPRYFGLNFAPFNEYGDILFTGGTEYDFPILTGGTSLLYRAYLYGAVDVTEVARARDVIQRRLRGRLLLDHFTPTFDVGLKMDTVLGTFTLSISYVVDLVL